jgi:hexosaminidase
MFSTLSRYLTRLALAALPLTASADGLSLLPRPAEQQLTGGAPFTLTAKASIAYTPELLPQASYLRDVVAASTGYDLSLRAGGKGTLRLLLDTVAVGTVEGYRLTITHRGVEVRAHDAAGAYYGIQTLLQCFPAAIYSERRQRDARWTAPALVVSDAPQRPWRGMMLDAARYYYDKAFVMKFIDMMSMYKLNKFQFHFIDDSGWRLEIKKYPLLTSVGAWAGSETERLGGYYTQDDIRDIVAYAAVRGVEVIPEIEFPAHLLSAVAAYPWLSCTGEAHEVPTRHFISQDLLCVGKPEALQFLHDVLNETADLFPSRYINIGGDEAVYTRWEQCPRCRALMQREGLSRAEELQGWLTNVVAGWLRERGRTAVGWEEIVMRGKVSTPVVGVVWHNVGDTLTLRRDGHHALLSPASHLYFDFPESDLPGEPPHATWQPHVPLEKTYALPVADYAPGSATLGVQGCLWSDLFIHGCGLPELAPLDENRSEHYVEYFTFPRLLALAEVGWTAQRRRDYDDFRQRLAAHFTRLDAKGCHYRVPLPRLTAQQPTTDGATFTLACDVDSARIHYTTDGQLPTLHSPRYESPVTLQRGDTLRAITVVTSQHYSLPLTVVTP